MSVFEQSPQERWQIVTHPAALPGECFLCRGDSNSRDWFVDTGRQFEFHGAVYICNACLAEMAGTASFTTPTDTEAYRARINELEAEVFNLKLRNSAYLQMEKAINDFVESSGDSGGSITVLPSYVEQLQRGVEALRQADGNSTLGSSGAEEVLGAGAGAIDESGDGEGMVDVHADDSEPEPFDLKF